MEIFLVGGAVRDALLGYPFSEKDWVVVGARPNDLISLGYTQVGKDFPVFLHPETKEEYALARKERKTAAGYTGFAFDTDPSVTLNEDLSRRDLTINAIAQDNDGEYIDPFNGVSDIENRILRHVSDAFCEDPVRLLRIARFAARYHHLGFSVAPETMKLLSTMVKNGEVNALVAERIWKEFEKALAEKNPEVFIEVLRACGALKVIMPELDALFGVPQVEKHHPEIDTGVHALLSLKQACTLSENTQVRFACLVHDLGKALTRKNEWPKHHGHESLGLPALDSLAKKIKLPNEHHALAKITMEFHTHCHRAFELKASTILTLFKNTDAYRKPARFLHFLLCCKADATGRTGYENKNYAQANFLIHALSIVQEVKADIFIREGIKGKELGDAIEAERLHRIKKLVKENKQSLKFYTA